MPSLQPRQLLSINVATPSPITIEGRQIMTAIGKRAVSTLADPQRVAVRPLGLQGDDQADTSVHGGLSKAVYAYPHEHYTFWQTVRAQAQAQDWGAPLPHGMLGENLTLTGLLEGDVYVGDVLQFPDCTLAISEPRRPCYKFQAVMGFKQAVKMMAQSGYCGFYLTVRQPGTIAAGESYDVIPGAREVSIAELFKARMQRSD
ncbi:MAG: MOSC domain-containing protein [Aquabacterium sp.]|uniref:MOSC domain-containing protein n=1 Tax=Aquabacterium sp. TaxID=1872578 RepID=UPI0025C42DCF|nr:MOSC domain-containing protein [Aquabacterium sp.]MBI3382171.1 MOSC domain-containing protein [Aquabacterium sp.]